MDINKQPNLEDLLKFKKAEQPNDAFWEKFDSDLQDKTLQTFIEQEPWYRILANKVTQYALSTSMACGLLFLMGIVLYLNTGSERNALISNMAFQNESLSADESAEYAVVANDALEKDYAVEIISIKGASEDYDFEADAISVAIGDTVDYSDAPVYASSDTLRISKQYTQLASFAF